MEERIPFLAPDGMRQLNCVEQRAELSFSDHSPNWAMQRTGGAVRCIPR